MTGRSTINLLCHKIRIATLGNPQAQQPTAHSPSLTSLSTATATAIAATCKSGHALLAGTSPPHGAHGELGADVLGG